MKQINSTLSYVILITTMLLTACKKENIHSGSGHQNGGLGNPGNPGQQKPDSLYNVRVKATITIGDIVYDSIPALLDITTWDSNNLQHSKQIDLVAGVNEIALPKPHVKYKLKLSKWGLTDEISFTKEELQEEALIGLGGTRAAKKLHLEERYLLIADSYQPDAKSVYMYHPDGRIKQIDYYQKKPQHMDLKRYNSDVFVYAGNKVERIDRLDESDLKVGFTSFTYTPQGKVSNSHHKSYDQETGASFDYSYAGGNSNIDVDYLFSNGNTMRYTMKFKGGNKVMDHAVSSLGKRESGTYSYDFYINPFAHVDMPNQYLSNLSKNNIVSQQKSYVGAIPSAEPYEFGYKYDAQGYPIELLRSYKSYTTGEHLYKTKTVYTY